MGLRCLILAAGGAALALAGGAPPAAADTELGSSHGFRYIESDPGIAPSGQTTAEQPNCGATQPAVGGGVEVGGTAAEAWITDSQPIQAGVDTNAWQTIVNNQLGDPKSIDGFSICRKAGFTGLKFPKSAITTIPSYHVKVVKVACPKGASVLGGGPGPGADVVLSTNPYDGPDGDLRPDDGWSAKVYNSHVSSESVQVHAVCTTKGLSKLHYEEGHKSSVVGPTGVNEHAECGTGRALVAGGVSIAGVDANAAQINEAFPEDTNADGVPNNRFSALVWANSGSGMGITTRAFAVCFG